MTDYFFGDERLPSRFWGKVSISDSGCWNWTASRSDRTGYGWFRSEGRARSAHRVSCEAFHGVRDSSWYAMHSCDNRLCVNPAHLKWGSPRDNTVDAINKGRMSPGEWHRNRTHCRQGHEYTPENTYISPRDAARVCRECYRQHWRRWNERRTS